MVTVEVITGELKAGAETHSYIDNALAVLGDGIPVVSPASSTTQGKSELRKSLDPGEAQALAVAAVTDGLIVTDDGDGRTTAKQRGLDLTGSIGLLVRFVDTDALGTEVAETVPCRVVDDTVARLFTFTTLLTRLYMRKRAMSGYNGRG
jgi:predicted nucleic acid-binding protein